VSIKLTFEWSRMSLVLFISSFSLSLFSLSLFSLSLFSVAFSSLPPPSLDSTHSFKLAFSAPMSASPLLPLCRTVALVVSVPASVLDPLLFSDPDPDRDAIGRFGFIHPRLMESKRSSTPSCSSVGHSGADEVYP